MASSEAIVLYSVAMVLGNKKAGTDIACPAIQFLDCGNP